MHIQAISSLSRENNQSRADTSSQILEMPFTPTTTVDVYYQTEIDNFFRQSCISPILVLTQTYSTDHNTNTTEIDSAKRQVQKFH